MPRKKKPDGGQGGGYGQPPKAHQWQKGQSGNPKGRPRKTEKPTSPYSQDDPFVFANTVMQVRVDGKIKDITRSQALYNRIFQSAMEGKAWAAKLMLAIFQKGEEQHAEMYAIWLDMESQLDPEHLDRVPKKMQMAINMSRKHFGVPPIAFTEAQGIRMEIAELESDPEYLKQDEAASYLKFLREELARAREREAIKRKGWRR